MKQLSVSGLSISLLVNWVGRANGQATIVFNNLDKSDGRVLVYSGHFTGDGTLLSRDLNFQLSAGPPGGPVNVIHTWLLSDGSAKGINVAPELFADPTSSVFVVPGVAEG